MIYGGDPVLNAHRDLRTMLTRSFALFIFQLFQVIREIADGHFNAALHVRTWMEGKIKD